MSGRHRAERGGAMTALVTMRLVGFARTGRAFAPLVAVLVVLGIFYGGGQAQAGEAYGVSAAIMFVVLAWQTKILLDVEPDVQRRLARVAVGGPEREVTAGVGAALLAGLPVIAIALVLPWLLGGVTTPQRVEDPPLIEGIVLGVWAHLLLLVPAVALGALASRAVAGDTGRGLSVLLVGAIGTIVLGLKGSPIPWVAPPVMPVARDTVGGADFSHVFVATTWGLAWSAVAFAGYVWLRRTRA
jgi:hypothetical protein